MRQLPGIRHGVVDQLGHVGVQRGQRLLRVQDLIERGLHVRREMPPMIRRHCPDGLSPRDVDCEARGRHGVSDRVGRRLDHRQEERVPLQRIPLPAPAAGISVKLKAPAADQRRARRQSGCDCPLPFGDLRLALHQQGSSQSSPLHTVVPGHVGGFRKVAGSSLSSEEKQRIDAVIDLQREPQRLWYVLALPEPVLEPLDDDLGTRRVDSHFLQLPNVLLVDAFASDTARTGDALRLFPRHRSRHISEDLEGLGELPLRLPERRGRRSGQVNMASQAGRRVDPAFSSLVHSLELLAAPFQPLRKLLVSWKAASSSKIRSADGIADFGKRRAVSRRAFPRSRSTLGKQEPYSTRKRQGQLMARRKRAAYASETLRTDFPQGTEFNSIEWWLTLSSLGELSATCADALGEEHGEDAVERAWHAVAAETHQQAAEEQEADANDHQKPNQAKTAWKSGQEAVSTRSARRSLIEQRTVAVVPFDDDVKDDVGIAHEGQAEAIALEDAVFAFQIQIFLDTIDDLETPLDRDSRRVCGRAPVRSAILSSLRRQACTHPHRPARRAAICAPDLRLAAAATEYSW
eukprot:scaffold1410_cov242-Pinguiococcus_pyrenoidosus.AAC.15